MHFGQKIDLGTVSLDLKEAIEDVLKESKTIYNKVLSIPKNVETDIVSYVVPVGKAFIIWESSGSAGTDTIFRIYVDSTVYETQRNSWTQRNVGFKTKQIATAGQTVKITGEHNSHLYNVGFQHDLEASITGFLVDA